MNVPGVVFADDKLMDIVLQDKSLEQVVNVASLPGINKVALAMPDIHLGYGFPIGGVAAFDINNGIISPGGVGYDINCGVRLLKTNLRKEDVLPKIKDLIYVLFNGIPSGLGSSGAIKKLSFKDEKEVAIKGAKWAVENGFGNNNDLDFIEENGMMKGANPSLVSDRAYERGSDQIGTLGSGNHFIEIDIVDEIYDERIANVFGLHKDDIAVLFHTGSRGFGYQICDDYLKVLKKEYSSFGIEVVDKQLACAPIKSDLGQEYYSAMVCAVNYAFANRQVITFLIRNVFEKFFKISPKELNMNLIYDVAHNIAKFEEHFLDNKKIKLCVHRKGATRAFPANHSEIPDNYKSVGQPVLIPGDMGRSSFVLVGTEKAMEWTFGSTSHGAGRVMSRNNAMREARGRSITKDMEEKGITVVAKEKATLAEEMSEAYKNIEDVINVISSSGISKKVVKLKPIGVIKG
jgi:tRNA-splicing ligase RtcB